MESFKFGTRFSWREKVWLITFVTNDNYYALIENETGERDIRSIDSLETFKEDGILEILN